MSSGPVVRRVWAGVGQAVESAAIAAVGLVLCALVLLAVWGIDQGFAGDPLLQWRLAADAWLLGHGVDVGVSLGRGAVLAVGLEQAGRSFVLSLGMWGIGALTLWLHWRAGRRLAALPLLDATIAVVLGAAATAAVGLLVGVSAQHAVAAPNLAQSAILPALVALVGMAAAVLAARGHDWLVAVARVLTLEEQWLRPIRAALRAGFGAFVGVLGVGALLVALGLLVRFTDALLLLESLGVTPVGVVVMTLLQLALAPVAIVWGASWAVGPGFVLGAGSSVSPLGTDLGPVPALPLLAAIDPSAQPWMAVAVALPVLAAVLVGVLARQTVLAGDARSPVHWWELALAAAGGGVLGGALLGVAAMLATGAAGPGRLGETGPDAVLVAAWGALELGVGLLLGMLAGGRGAGALAAEGEGTSLRDVLGLGRGRSTDARQDDARSEWSEPHEHEVLEPDRERDADAQETEALDPVPVGEPVPGDEPSPRPASSSEPGVLSPEGAPEGDRGPR